MTPMVALLLALKLLASALGVYALYRFAIAFRLGGEARIRDADHARQLAAEGIYGFQSIDAAVDMAGYSALVRDPSNRHVLVSVLGDRFVARLLRAPVEGRLDQRMLTIDPNEMGMEPVTLNLGEAAQYWASGLRHIPTSAGNG